MGRQRRPAWPDPQGLPNDEIYGNLAPMCLDAALWAKCLVSLVSFSSFMISFPLLPSSPVMGRFRNIFNRSLRKVRSFGDIVFVALLVFPTPLFGIVEVEVDM